LTGFAAMRENESCGAGSGRGRKALTGRDQLSNRQPSKLGLDDGQAFDNPLINPRYPVVGCKPSPNMHFLKMHQIYQIWMVRMRNLAKTSRFRRQMAQSMARLRSCKASTLISHKHYGVTSVIQKSFSSYMNVSDACSFTTFKPQHHTFTYPSPQSPFQRPNPGPLYTNIQTTPPSPSNH
jgi:hypothetical protein